MIGLGVIGGLLKEGAVFYLVTHGVSLPAGSEEEVQELALGLYYSSLAWLEVHTGWVAALLALVTGLASGLRASLMRPLLASLLAARMLTTAGLNLAHAAAPEAVQAPAPGSEAAGSEEAAPPRPSPQHVWVPGPWVWRGPVLGYVWVPGRWALPVSRAYVLVEGPLPTRLQPPHRLILR